MSSSSKQQQQQQQQTKGYHDDDDDDDKEDDDDDDDDEATRSRRGQQQGLNLFGDPDAAASGDEKNLLTYDFRFGEIPKNIEKVGDPVQLTRVGNKGAMSVLTIPSGTYLKAKFDDAKYLGNGDGVKINLYTISMDIKVDLARSTNGLSLLYPFRSSFFVCYQHLSL